MSNTLVLYQCASHHHHHQQQPINSDNKIENVRNVFSGLAMRDLSLRRIDVANRITIIHRRFLRPKLFCVDHSASTGAMADEANKNSRLGNKSSTLNINKNKDEAEERPEKLPPPPPPEKPLSGDCCGSGCVRCVWDVYYEELEAYNKLLSESKSK